MPEHEAVVNSATYKIIHVTTYHYADTVPVCHNEVHLTPRETAWQSCKYHRLTIKPHPNELGWRRDYFGNQTHHFTIEEGHRRLSISAFSRVEVRPMPLNSVDESPAWETVRDAFQTTLDPTQLDAVQFRFGSPSVVLSPALREYAEPSFATGRPILDAVRDLTARIHAEFKYDPRATTVNTPLEDVLEFRRGVCQDFAHLEIGCLRALGICARYVSGYLRTIPAAGRPRLVGADASHAWLSVFCKELGWVDVDPTNDCFPSTDHITIAWGRDYTDVCPINGVFVGGGTHSMAVSVDVEPLSDENSHLDVEHDDTADDFDEIGDDHQEPE